MSDFDEYQTTARSPSPPWLSKVAGLAWSLVLGIFKQAFLEAGKQAATLSFPSLAPTDALAEVAKQRDLVFGFPEKLGLLRERLRTGWRVHALDGSYPGIILAIKQVGYENVSIVDHGDDPTIPEWFFRVVLNRPFPFDDQHLSDGFWGDPGAWGDGGLWAEAMPPGHLGFLQALIAKHKATESRCLGIRVIYDVTNPIDVIDLAG